MGRTEVFWGKATRARGPPVRPRGENSQHFSAFSPSTLPIRGKKKNGGKDEEETNAKGEVSLEANNWNILDVGAERRL